MPEFKGGVSGEGRGLDAYQPSWNYGVVDAGGGLGLEEEALYAAPVGYRDNSDQATVTPLSTELVEGEELTLFVHPAMIAIAGVGLLLWLGSRRG